MERKIHKVLILIHKAWTWIHTCLGDTVIDEPEQEDTIQYTTTERQRKAALFILKAREERMLTQKALNGLLEDITCKYSSPF